MGRLIAVCRWPLCPGCCCVVMAVGMPGGPCTSTCGKEGSHACLMLVGEDPEVRLAQVAVVGRSVSL